VSIKNFILDNPLKGFLLLIICRSLETLYSLSGGFEVKKAGYSHRTAQPPTLAAFRPWEGSAGAGRVRPAGRKDKEAKVFGNCENGMSMSIKVARETLSRDPG
jgi:hypothetical protein